MTILNFVWCFQFSTVFSKNQHLINLCTCDKISVVMGMKLPKRKSPRMAGFDYSTNTAYFITICTDKKQKILCDFVGDGVYDIPQTNLTVYGKIVQKHIEKMSSQYDNIHIDNYVIMPNHIHMIIKITEQFENRNILNGSSQAPTPTNAIIPKFVSLFKRYCNRECGKNIWQRSFHDHIIRGEKDYRKIYEYISSNPSLWQEDKFYSD